MGGNAHDKGGHAAVLLAGGRSAAQRDGPDLAFLPLAGRRLVSRALTAVTAGTDVRRVAVVVHRSDMDRAGEVLAREAPDVDVDLVDAALSFQQSVLAGLDALAPAIDAGAYELVVLHDAARPLAGPHLTREVIATARRWGAAVPYLGVDDYVWVEQAGTPVRFSGRDNRVVVQTPQAFRADEALRAYRRAARDGFIAGTAHEAVERHCGRRVRGIPGDTRNAEIRSPHDLFAAEGLLADLGYVVT